MAKLGQYFDSFLSPNFGLKWLVMTTALLNALEPLMVPKMVSLIDIFGCFFFRNYMGSNEVVSQITTLDLFVIQLCYLHSLFG